MFHNAEMSTCKTRKVGAVLVRDNRVVADGFNGNLPGHTHCDEGGCDRCKAEYWKSGESLEHCVCIHAEQNVISYCAKNGVSTANTWIYLPFGPCLDCFKLVASSGIVAVIYGGPYGDMKKIESLAYRSDIMIREFLHGGAKCPLKNSII